MFTTSPGTNYMLQLDAANQPTSFTTQAGTGAWPYWGNPFGMTLDTDNFHVLVPGLVDPNAGTWALALWDPAVGRVASTLWQGPRNASSVINWSNWTLDSDGNPVTIDTTGSAQRIVEYDRWTGTWQSVALPAGTPDYAGLGGLEWDALDGGFVFAAWGSAGQQPSALLRADATGQQMITLALSANNVPRFGGTLLDSGDWIAPGSGTWRYWIVPRGSSLYVPGPPAQADTLSDVTREKFACPGQAFFATQYDAPRRVVHVDATSGQQVVVHTGTAATMPTTAAEVTPLYERDLATVRTGRATWDVVVNPGQGAFSGKAFHLAASLVPPRPPITLADGREIFIGSDGLLLMTLAGDVPPFFTGVAGVLDAQGQARARLNFQALGKSGNGAVIHLAGVILDPAAPQGIAWVLDPWAFVIEVRDS